MLDIFYNINCLYRVLFVKVLVNTTNIVYIVLKLIDVLARLIGEVDIMKIISEFKEFIMRGNVLDLAVGVIVGGAFTSLVKSLTVNLINPIIGLFTGQVSSLDNLKFVVSDQLTFNYGAFLGDVINFLIIAFVLFIIIKMINKVSIKKDKEEGSEITEISVLTDIRDMLAKQEANQK